jgi:hypothetical protein
MKKKTESEIRDEWRALPAFKKLIPRLDRYRVDRWAMIDAQVETLSGGYTLAEIVKHWDNDRGGDCRGAAEDALYWSQGGPVFSPVESWNILVKSIGVKNTP